MDKETDFYTLSNTPLGFVDFLDISLKFRLDDTTIFALYRSSLSEKTADLCGLKKMKKVLELNDKKYGRDDKSWEMFEKIKNKTLFESTEYVKKTKKFRQTEGIVTNENIILNGVSEELLKLLMLYNFYEIKIEECQKEKELQFKIIDEYRNEFNLSHDMSIFEDQEKTISKTMSLDKEINTYRDKNDSIVEIFHKTLKDGKFPDNFDENKEFEPLKISKQKRQNSLPKWLDFETLNKADEIEELSEEL